MDQQEQVLASGWKFLLGECENAWYQGMDDSGFREVLVPHDWAVEQPFSEQYSSGTGYLAGGIGWYRLHFKVPKEAQGKRVCLVFDGVYKNSQVWVNSYYLGRHPYGYTGFSYDISQIVHFGDEDNVASVKVSHPDLADSRWFTGSGIVRKVTLRVQEWVHQAEHGVYLSTKALDGEKAVLQVQHEAVNESGQDCRIWVETELEAPDGEVLLHLEKAVEVPAGGCRTCLWETELMHPLLWSPAHPHLYRMCSYYRTEDGRRYLVDEQYTGIRTARFDAEHGFYLNGIQTKIKGVCVHHDAGCLGAAVTEEVWQRRLEVLKQCGCNAIRCSHNPHMPELYALCDRLGFLVMDEAFDEWENAKNKWSTGHNVYPPKHQGYAEDFPEWHDRDLRAMVRRDRKHPSVILWSIGNEIDYPNDPYCHPDFLTMTGNNDANKPAAERQYDPYKPNAERMVAIARELSQTVHEEDQSRPVTMALAYPELSAKLGIFSVLDVAGYNYKEHLYAQDHSRYENMPFLGSENGHSYAAWQAVAANDYISGQFLWTGIDFLGEASGWPVHGSAAGLLDCAGFEKMQYYRRASFWKEEPVLALATAPEKEAGKTPGMPVWNYAPGEMVRVACYTNLPCLRLFLNGKEAGKDVCEVDGAYYFMVAFEPGKLEAKGYGEDGRQCCQALLLTSGKAETLAARIWKPVSADAFKSSKEHTVGYLYQVELKLLDHEKNMADTDEMVYAKVKGAGILAGMENGDLSDNTPYHLDCRKTNGGRLLAYIKRTGQGRIEAVFHTGPSGSNLQAAVTIGKEQ